jgi:hypothetical protein
MTPTLEQRTAAPTRWSVDETASSVEFAVKMFWGVATVQVASTASTARLFSKRNTTCRGST